MHHDTETEGDKKIALLISWCHQQLLTDCWEPSAHPTFYPEILLCDFNIFGSLKDIKRKYFKHNDEVGAKENVVAW